MWKCNGCGATFDDPETMYVDAEDLYGVGSMFSNHNMIPIGVCPDCGSEDFDEFWEDEDDFEDDDYFEPVEFVRKRTEALFKRKAESYGKG